MRFKSQKGSGLIIVVGVALALLAVISTAYYFGKKLSLEFGTTGFSFSGSDGLVEPPATEIRFVKTFNLNADQFTKEDIIKAKNLGANMVTIWPGRFIRDDQFSFFPERTTAMINFAHKNGLQVELRGSFSGEKINDYEKFKANAIAHVALFAQFAQKYKVSRIVPFGEIDNTTIGREDKITQLTKELLSEMRKHYQGQIGVGVVAPWRDSGFAFKGYDYLTVSVYPQTQTGMAAWLTTKPEINLVSVIDWARKVADRSDISTLHIGETGVQNLGEEDPSGFFRTAQVSKEKEAEFYQKLFEQVWGKVDGVSVFFNSRQEFMSVNGDPAEEIVKEWYSRL